MKSDKLKLLEIINEEINEIMDFNNIDSFNYNFHDTNDGLVGKFSLENGEIIEVFAQQIPSSVISMPPVFNNTEFAVNFVYSINGISSQYKKTIFSEFIKILKTVALIFKDYLNVRNNDSIYTLYSESKTGLELNDKQKQELYKLILSKQLPKNYRIGDGLYMNHIPVIIFQKLKNR